MRHVVCLLLALAAASRAASPAAAQDAAPDEVMAVVWRLFDAMRAGDSVQARGTFHPDGRLLSVPPGDAAGLRTTSVDGFVRAVGTPRDEVWDERIWDWEVRVDGRLATVWTPYAFYVGTRLSHCGVDAFQLFRGPDGWQIVNLVDTRRREACEVPPRAR